MQKRAIIYARVSTKEQSPEMQLMDLREYAKNRNFDVVNEYVDIDSGGNSNRKNYKKLWDDVKKKKTDIVLVWRFDRFSRNSKEMVEALDEFNHLGIDFISYMENIDTASPTGRFLFIVSSAFSQFELDIFKERVVHGLAKAKKKGIRLGRPTITKEKITECMRLYHDEHRDYKYISKKLDISIPMFYKIINNNKNE